jgi:hypothetical protein
MPILQKEDAKIRRACVWRCEETRSPRRCVFITAVPNKKLFAWGEGDCGGHVLYVIVYCYSTYYKAFRVEEGDSGGQLL